MREEKDSGGNLTPDMAMSVRKYKGKSDTRTWNEFLKEFYRIARIQGWSDKRKREVISYFFDAEALIVYESLGDTIKNDWKLLLDELAKRFSVGNEVMRCRKMLGSRTQFEDESTTRFGLTIKAL